MYTFHLTIDVRPDGHQAYRAYKLESLAQLRTAPGHRWTLLLHPQVEHPDRYYQVSQFESQAALDASGLTPQVKELLERVQPYQYMTRAPAHREVSRVLFDLMPDGSSPGESSGRGSHVRYTLRDTGQATALADELRAAPWPDGGGERTGRRLLLQTEADPSVVYYIAAPSGSAADPQPSPEGVVRSAVADPCEVMLELGRGLDRPSDAASTDYEHRADSEGPE